MPTVGLVAMQRANSTLEDFVSNFLFQQFTFSQNLITVTRNGSLKTWSFLYSRIDNLLLWCWMCVNSTQELPLVSLYHMLLEDRLSNTMVELHRMSVHPLNIKSLNHAQCYLQRFLFLQNCEPSEKPCYVVNVLFVLFLFISFSFSVLCFCYYYHLIMPLYRW